MMNLVISSEKLGNPLLVELLRRLHHIFAALNHDFFVIGATARDIVLDILANTSARRKTRDLDIAIAVTGWDNYAAIQQELINNGFEKAIKQVQRFYYGDYEIDLVPYGGVAKPDDNIYWPPEETIAMSVKGFDEALRDAITVSIDGIFDIKIASLHGLFLLKLNAWIDRHIQTNKDAEDIWYIIDNYYFANEARNIHQEVYEIEDFTLTSAGAFWLAHDISDLLNPRLLRYYLTELKSEICKKEDSRLLIQILETARGVKMTDVLRAFDIIIEVLEKRIGDD